MLFILISTCALIFTCYYYYKPRINILHLFSVLYLNLLYSVTAIEEVLYDIINTKNNKTSLVPMDGHVAIVTGGSRGIGSEVVKMLLQCNMEVIIACRTPSAGEKLISEIRESGITTGKAKVYKLDNASLESVKEFANRIKNDYNKINILINNAGIMFCSQIETEDGFDLQWSTNYLSHFYLTALLLPLLKAASSPKKNSRIVNVTSCAHRYGCLQVDDVLMNYSTLKEYNTYLVYGQTKFAQLMSTKHLQNLFKEKNLGIQVYAVHPGIVQTELFQHTYVRIFQSISKYLIKTPKQGAISIVYAATNDKIEGHGGIYISNCKEDNAHPFTNDKSCQEKLLRLSLNNVQLKDIFQFIDI